MSKILMSGVVMGESPRWHDDRLWFCDWGAQELIAVDLDGKSEVVTRVPARPFCIDWLPDGRLLVAAGDARVLRREPDGSLVPYADLTGLSTKPWNEIVVDSRGNAYVNNIGFDFGEVASEGGKLSPGGEVAPGIVALVAPDGSVRQVADGVSFPNGMVVTPDDSTLIVAESYANCLTAFDIAADGGLSNRRVWARVDGFPDGICLDADGSVWYADVPNKHCVRVREGGAVVRTVELDRGCFSCALGGVDGRTLFIVAAEWSGAEGMMSGPPTGQVVAVDV